MCPLFSFVSENWDSGGVLARNMAHLNDLNLESSKLNLPSEDIRAKEINVLLSKGSDKDSFANLSSFLDICSDRVFLSNCVQWMQYCCKSIKSNDDNEIILNLLVKLIKMSVNFPELVRPVSNSVGPRFCDALFKKLSQNSKGWEVMEELMFCYSGSVAHCKGTLDSLMLSSLLSCVCPMYQARCWALIPAVGGGGASNAHFKSNWSAQFDRFITNSHEILNLLFIGVPEFQTYSCEGNSSLKLPNDAPCQVLVNYLCNIFKTLECMLLGRFPVAKNVPAGKILELINRVLSVTCLSGGHVQSGCLLPLQELLPTVNIASVKVLTGLVVCVGRALLPTAHNIAKMLMLLVQQSRGSPQLRLHIYSSLSNWVAVSGSACCLENGAREIIHTLLNDFEVKQEPVKLKEKNKKVKLASSRRYIVLHEMNDVLCIAALKTVGLMVTAVGFKLGADIQKGIQCRVIGQLGVCMGSSNRCRSMSPRCRAALFSLLHTLCLEPCALWPPPSQFALQLFRIGVYDTDPHVASICATSLSVLEKILHPEFSVATFRTDDMLTADPIIPLQSTSSFTLNLVERSELEIVKSPKLHQQKIRPISKSSSPWQVAQADTLNGKNSNGVHNNEISVTNHLTNCNEGGDVAEMNTNIVTSDVILPNLPDSDNEDELNLNIKRRKVVANKEEREPTNNLLSSGQKCNLTETEDLVDTESDSESRHVTSDDSVAINAASLPSKETQDVNAGIETNLSEYCNDEKVHVASRKPNDETKRSRMRSYASDLSIDLNSPMSLRSGTLVTSSSSVSSSESRRRVRDRDDSSSVSSRSVQSSPCSGGPPDPDTLMDVFDDTLRADLQ